MYCFGLVYEVALKKHNFLYGEENPFEGSDNVASILFHYLRNLAPTYLQVVDHLVVCTDGCAAENTNKTACAARGCFVKSGECANLRKLTVIRIEVVHTKFSPDAGFGHIRNCEKNFTYETIHDVRRMVFESTPMSNRNVGHIFDSASVKKWHHHTPFKAIPIIRKAQLIHFVQLVRMLSRALKTGPQEIKKIMERC